MIPATTKMSAKGQIVIPAAIRQRFQLETGTEFIIVAKDDVIVLRRITEPPWKEFESVTGEARRQGHHMDLAMLALKKAFTKMRNVR